MDAISDFRKDELHSVKVPLYTGCGEPVSSQLTLSRLPEVRSDEPGADVQNKCSHQHLNRNRTGVSPKRRCTDLAKFKQKRSRSNLTTTFFSFTCAKKPF